MILSKCHIERGKKIMEMKNNIPRCVIRIEQIYLSLRDSEKKVCDYIKQNYETIIHLTITELAEKCGTSESTVVRLCKNLGYRGFQDMKINLAQDTIKPSHQIYEELELNDNIETIKNKVFNAEIQGLYDTLEVLKTEDFKKAVDMILNAKRIEFYGVGGSGPVIFDAQHKFLKIGYKAFASVDNNLQVMSASLLQKGDLVIGISHSGESKDIIEAFKIARGNGASTLAITNFNKSSILKVSDVVLYTASKETAFKSDAMTSRIAELAIIDSLFISVAFKNYDKSYECILKTRDATVSKKY